MPNHRTSELMVYTLLWPVYYQLFVNSMYVADPYAAR